MPYGYLGTQPNQTVKNTGVLSVTEAAELQSQGKLGGSLELIEEQTYSSAVSFVDFTSIHLFCDLIKQSTKYLCFCPYIS